MASSSANSQPNDTINTDTERVPGMASSSANSQPNDIINTDTERVRGMASSSENSQPNDIINTELIIKLISELTSHLREVKSSVSQFDNKESRLASHVDSPCLQLTFIEEAFEKPTEKIVKEVCSKLNDLQANFYDIPGEIQNAANKTNQAELIQTQLTKLTRNIIDIKELLPSFQQESTAVYRAKKGITIGKTFSCSSEPYPSGIPAEDPASFSSWNFSHMIEALDSRSRECLWSFSVFPVNAVINQRVLKNWWHGEGFLGSSSREAEDVADKILRELMARCFIEAVREQCRLVGVRLYPSVHPLVIRHAASSGFCSFDSKGNLTMELPAYSRAFLAKTKEESSRDDLLDATEADNFEKLETLFNISEAYPDLKQELLLKMKNIKVLSLGNWQNNYDHIELENVEFLKGLKNRRSLRLLSIRGISGVTELPELFCKQSNLRVLDLKSCHNLQALPKDIGMLKKLTYLDMTGCYLLDWMPKGLASLTELRVLKGLVVNSADSCAFCDLNGLTKLRKLSIYTNRHDFPKEEELSVFKKFEELENLSIIWGWSSKLSKAKNESTTQDHTARNREEHVKPSPVRQASEVGSSGNISVAKGDKRRHAGPEEFVELKDQRRLEDIPEEQDKNLVGLSNQRKTKNDEGIIEECNIASEATVEQPMEQPNIGDGDGVVRGDNIVMDEELGGATPADFLNKESVASRNIAANLVGTEAKNDVGDRESASPRKASKIRIPNLRKTLTRKLTMKQEKGEESKSQEIFRSLKKLDIQCYPLETAPAWLKPEDMRNLKMLYFRGGKLEDLSNIQSSAWGVEILRLRFLPNLTLQWGSFQASFPKLILVEKVDCPNIVAFPKYQDGLLLIRREDPNKSSTKV